MGFYIRKSINVGPLRFNLSKNGVGVSTGIPGLRVGYGPKGNYVHVGKGGLYYRKTFSDSQGKSPLLQPNQLIVDEVVMTEIESSSVLEMTDSSAIELLEELNGKRRKSCFWGLIAVFSLFLHFTIGLNGWAVLAAILTTFLVYWVDQLRKTTVLFYAFDPKMEEKYLGLHEAFEKIQALSRAWHVEAQGHVHDTKYHAGANNLLGRKSISISKGTPPYVKTNIVVPILPAGKQMLYFFPERILVYEGDKVGAISYSDLSLETYTTRFIETESVPKEAEIIGQTWRYTNKTGGPDRRFKDNRQIPIALYEEMALQSPSGLNERFLLPLVGVSADFIKSIENL